MNRIYQGRVARVEILNPNAAEDSTKLPVKNWQEVLWKHHELFQDAVNYYGLCLAALAEGLDPDSDQAKAALGWREQVRDTWKKARRRAEEFAGPHERIAPLLGLDASTTGFEDCAGKVLEKCNADRKARAAALLQLLTEADQSDLNQMCVGRLPWFCTPKGQLNSTPRSVVAQQEGKMLEDIRAVHDANTASIKEAAAKLEVGYFVTQFPKERLSGDEARDEAIRLFDSVARKSKNVASLREDFIKQLNRDREAVSLPRLGRKPKGTYPVAVVFKLFPVNETWEVFKKATASALKKAPPVVQADFIAEARVNDQPLFDYFTNRALVRNASSQERAVWFEFDLAAFIEAIKAPHRYFQDTLKREKLATEVRTRLAAIEGRGGKFDDEHDEDEQDSGPFGFDGDERIDLLRELVTDKLGYAGEADQLATGIGKIEYTIQERTLRGFADIKKEWCRLAEKGPVTEDKLLEVLKEHQAKHREDFGSATLYRALAEPKYHSIWRDTGKQPWHAADPLKAWRIYTELQFELMDKERPIRFTPAHPTKSPRYFIIPKQGRFGSDHRPGELAFTCGVVFKTAHGYEPLSARVRYAAPRLCRDRLRHPGDKELGAVPWLQPMMEALELKEPDTTDFSNCRVTLQPYEPDNIQLTFPVEVSPEKVIAELGKAAKWRRQFNAHPDGESFHDATLRWPHEKQPSKPPKPWWESLDQFSALAIDLGQRDAGAFALLSASANDDFDNKPSRFIGEAGDKKWQAGLSAIGLLRLSGEDRKEWRDVSTLERERGGSGFAWREELYGERGRSATTDETQQCAALLQAFGVNEDELMPADWRRELSFPEQNSKLLIAARRAQSRVARLHRWCWFLTESKYENKIENVLAEISELEDERVLSNSTRILAKADTREALGAALKTTLENQMNRLPGLLVILADRCVPLRGRRWAWNPHPDARARSGGCNLLEMVDAEDRHPMIRGQRGLSLERIEQIEELRRRFQSLNQTMRRTIGGPPPKSSRAEGGEIPDPCPDLLEKLDNLKEQRVNQTAHMILAEALGLRLTVPASNKAELKRTRDQHGIYDKILRKDGSWRGVVDFIVIENLSRYQAWQGRAPRENSRLMKWCHRSIRDKLRELCEPFGIPVLETPAAWSSRFCSRSGVAGFRAMEVGPGFENDAPWYWLKEKKDGGKPTEEAKCVQELMRQVEEARLIPSKANKPRTLLAPLTGGSIFVPIVDEANTDMRPTLAQADVNAAINLGLRAIADPRLWTIHPRLRSMRNAKDGTLIVREKRKFGDRSTKAITFAAPAKEVDLSTRQPNFFADFAGCATWGQAKLEGEDVPLVAGVALWTAVKKQQWARCLKINERRLQAWRMKEDNVPM